ATRRPSAGPLPRRQPKAGLTDRLHCRSRWAPPAPGQVLDRRAAQGQGWGEGSRALASLLRRSRQVHIELPLHGRPIKVCVLPRDSSVGPCDHVNTLTRERLTLRCSAHLRLADEVSIADVDPALVEA